MKLTPDNAPTLDFAKHADGLLPAVVQDADTARVLMLGYVTAESLARTFDSGHVTFYSRSKRRLWTKGETSGHVLRFEAGFADCDRDAVLLLARPQGPTCHTGAASCFGEPGAAAPPTPLGDLAFLRKLEGLLHERTPDAESDSYTSRLLAKGPMKVAQKVGEEGVELALEAVGGTDELLLEEAADLMYHYLLLLRAKGKHLADVVEVLESRHSPKGA